MKTILLTGAAGGIGTFLRKEFKGKYNLRLSDIAPIGDLAGDETYVPADLTDLDAVQTATDGVDGIFHLGGHAFEGDWQTILDANIIGVRNLYESAYRTGVKRVVFASSNHAAGFYRRDQIIDHTAIPRPDSRYGASKAFGEAMGALYADKYGMEITCIRIGNVAMEPADKRRLAIWISPRDLAQLVSIGLDHPDIRYEIFYGMSDNRRAWWDNANAMRFGYAPQDRSEDFAKAVLAAESPKADGDPTEIYQGGTFVNSEAGRAPVKNR
ncbi:MAG: NAD(P)-dependent oxidoreductase [Alphaproteobacteria bacterium]